MDARGRLFVLGFEVGLRELRPEAALGRCSDGRYPALFPQDLSRGRRGRRRRRRRCRRRDVTEAAGPIFSADLIPTARATFGVGGAALRADLADLRAVGLCAVVIMRARLAIAFAAAAERAPHCGGEEQQRAEGEERRRDTARFRKNHAPLHTPAGAPWQSFTWTRGMWSRWRERGVGRAYVRRTSSLFIGYGELVVKVRGRLFLASDGSLARPREHLRELQGSRQAALGTSRKTVPELLRARRRA